MFDVFFYYILRMRKSTHDRLVMIESGPVSALLDQLTKNDPLYPLLTNDHLLAIDRRVNTVLQIVDLCAQARSWDEVLVPF